MTQFGHRDPGLVGAVFENDAIYAPVILDGVHCSYAAARIAYKQKKEKLFLITDATFLGRKIENFKWGNFDAHLENGFYRNSEGNLAGATISMQEAIINAVDHMNISLDEAVKMATCRVAAAINMQNEIGKIKEGFPAQFVSFNEDLTQMQTLLL
jgi:N-acetylglucosamine-6-phosphate deacetylase